MDLCDTVQEVAVIGQLTAARVAVLVLAWLYHRASAIVGVVTERDQAPVGSLAGVVGQRPEGGAQDEGVAVRSRHSKNSLLVGGVLLATKRLSWVVGEWGSVIRIIALVRVRLGRAAIPYNGW